MNFLWLLLSAFLMNWAINLESAAEDFSSITIDLLQLGLVFLSLWIALRLGI